MLRLNPRDVADEMPKPRRRVRRRDTRYRPTWNAPAETLEIRIVPTIDVWTGAGLTSNFSDQNNWQGHAIPEAGDNLDFPAGSENATPYDDMDGVWFGQITIDAAGYSLGSDVGLPTTGISTTFNLGDATISGGVTLANDGATTMSVAAGGELDINGTIDGISGLTLTGGGTLITDGVTSNTYTGTTTVDSGTLQTAKLLGAIAVPGNLTIGDGTDTASVQNQDDDQFGSTTAVTIAANGTLDLNGFDEVVAGLTLHGGSVTTNGGTLTLDGDVTDDDTADPLTISGNLVLGGSTVTFHVSSEASLELDGSIGGNAGLSLMGGGTLRLAGSQAVNQYGGATEVDAGTLELDVTNPTLPAIPGALIINNGATVRDLADYQMVTPTVITENDGSTFDLNGHDDAISGLLLDDSSVTTGGGTLSILGDIVVKDSSAIGLSTFSGNLSLYNSINVTIAPGVTLDIDGAISGTGTGLSLDADASLPDITPQGGGTLVFSGSSANTYTGMTTVATGQLRLDKSAGAALAGPLMIGDPVGDSASVQDEADDQLGSGITVYVYQNTSLVLNGFDDSVGPLDLLGGSVTTNDGDSGPYGTLTLDGPVAADTTGGIIGNMMLGADITFTVGPNQTLTLEGPISGSHGLTLGYSQTLPDNSYHSGGGTLVMSGTTGISGANTYTGTTSVQYGTLQLSKAGGTVAVPGLLVISDPNGNAATVEESNSQIHVGGDVDIYGGGQLDLNGNDQGLSTLNLFGTDDGTVVQTNGAGVLTLSDAIMDTATSALTIDGTVDFYSDVTVTVISGGRLDIDASISGDSSSLTLDGDANLPGGQGLSDGGVLELSGMGDNTYGGTTTVNAGILLLNKDGGAIAIPGSLVIGTTGPAAIVEDMQGGQFSGEGDVTLNPGGLLELDGNNDAISNLDLNGGTVTTGSGVLTLNGNVNYEGGAPSPTLLAANLNLNSDEPTFDIHRGEYLVLQGVISGGSGFRLTDSGTLKLWGSTASNTYSGTTYVDMGTLIVDNAAGTIAIPGDLVVGQDCGGNIVEELASGQIAPTSHLTVGYESLFNLEDNDQTIAGLTLNEGGVALGAGTLTLAGDVSVPSWGEIYNNRYADGPDYEYDGAEGSLDLGGVRTFNITGEGLGIAALITDGSIVKDGDGELDLDGDSSDYEGTTQVNAGELDADGSDSLGQTSGVTVDNGATLSLDNVATDELAITLGGGVGTSDSTLKLYGEGDDSVTPATPVNRITNLVLDGNATVDPEDGSSWTVNGLSSGDVANHRLTVAGNGTLRLIGTITSGDPIVVDGATLEVAASNPLTGTVSVESGGGLGGSSAIGAVTSTGGTVGAVASYSPQTLTVASLSLDAGSTFTVDIAGNTPGTDGYDQVISSGAVDLGGATLSVKLNGYTPQVGDTFTIIKGTSTPTGAFNGLPEGSLIQAGGYSFRITYKGGAEGDNVVLSYVQASTTTLSSSSTVSTYGQTVTLTATVTAAVGSPVGSVTFTDGSTILGTVPLTPLGKAVLPLGILSVGYHEIVATYSGASAFTTSASTTLGQVIKQAATGATLSLSASPIVIGQSVTLTARVAPTAGSGTPSGSVSFYDGSTKLGTVQLSSGTATYATSTLAAGSHALTAVYGGDTNYLADTSSSTPLAVHLVGTSTVLGTSTGLIVLGQSATFVAYVSWLAGGTGNPAGSVTFMDGSKALGQVNLVNGWATLTTAGLGVGGHGVTAIYSGNATNATSQSTAVSSVVTPDLSTTTVTTSTPQAVYGQAVTLTATVGVNAPGTATQTGTVTFMDGLTALGTAPVVNGKATFTAPPMGVGYHYLYAIYGGNAQVAQSYSPAIGQTVFQAHTGTGFVSSAKVATYGQMVTYSAAVAAVAPGAGTPTGLVTFYDGSTFLGSSQLFGGMAALTVAATGVGLNHPITVHYSGDANFIASVSEVLTETVTRASARVTAYEQILSNGVFFPTAVLAVTPSAATPTGTLTFFANGKQIGQATLVNGTAGISLAGFGVVTQSVTVFYSGDANYSPVMVVPKIIYA